MLDRSVLRWGGLSAMIGAAIGLVSNFMHPRASGIDTSREELDLVAGSDIWLLDHYLIGWSLAAAAFGLIAIALSRAEEPARSWGRVALGFGIASIAIAFAAITVDGMALKAVADNWAASPDDAAAFAAGDAVAQIALALFTATIASLFGVTPLAYGIACLSREGYPKWLGYLAVGSGLLGMLASSMIVLGGVSDAAVNYMFTPASVGYTVWLFFSGWYLWKGEYMGVAMQPIAGDRVI